MRASSILAMACILVASQALAHDLDEARIASFHAESVSIQNPAMKMVASLHFETPPTETELREIKECITVVLDAANQFSKEKNKEILSGVLPLRVVFVDSAESLSMVARKPLWGDYGQYVGWCMGKQETLFTVRGRFFTLGHEFGHWYFGHSESLADRFGDFVNGRYWDAIRDKIEKEADAKEKEAKRLAKEAKRLAKEKAKK